MTTDNLSKADSSTITFNSDSKLLGSKNPSSSHPSTPNIATTRSTPTSTNTYAHAVKKADSQTSNLSMLVAGAISKQFNSDTLIETQYQQITTTLMERVQQHF